MIAPKPLRYPSPAALTTLELLICIAVVGILFVLLHFGTSAVRQRSLMTGDLANYRQIAAALFRFQAENRYRMPPIQEVGGKTCAHDYLAQYLGITVNLHDPGASRSQLAPLISPGDRRSGTQLSALRSYAVNYYCGEISNLPDASNQVKYYYEIVAPSRKIYMLTADGDQTHPDQQARFTFVSRPIVDGAGGWMEIRFYRGETAPALWLDGHASPISKAELQQKARALILPRLTP